MGYICKNEEQPKTLKQLCFYHFPPAIHVFSSSNYIPYSQTALFKFFLHYSFWKAGRCIMTLRFFQQDLTSTTLNASHSTCLGGAEKPQKCCMLSQKSPSPCQHQSHVPIRSISTEQQHMPCSTRHRAVPVWFFV